MAEYLGTSGAGRTKCPWSITSNVTDAHSEMLTTENRGTTNINLVSFQQMSNAMMLRCNVVSSTKEQHSVSYHNYKHF